MEILIIMGLTTLCVGGLAYAVMAPRIAEESVRERRMGALGPSSDPRRVNAVDDRKKKAKKSRVAEAVEEIEARQKTLGKPNRRELLEQAGLAWTAGTFLTVTLCAGLICAAVAFVGGLGTILSAIAGVLGAVALPRLYVARKRKKRLAKFVEELPNAIDVIVRGVKSGLPLNDCIMIISKDAAEPVRSEFQKVMEAQAAGITISEGLDRLHRRVPVAETNFLAIVVAIQAKAGGSMSEALGNLSQVLRDRKKMKGKIAAMAMEAKASAGVIGALPLVIMLLLYFAAPEYIALMFTTFAGNVMLGIAAFWMLIGTLIMRKMINFDF